jgi:hypothetical protein
VEAATKDTKGTRGILCAAAVLLILLSNAAGFVAAQDLPPRLSDSEFWRLIEDFSEANGQFQWENFVSNEFNLQAVIPELLAKSGPASAYLGVGPEQNFTYIAALHPKIAFIIDIRRQNLLEHLMYKSIFELSRDRGDFVSLLFARKRPEGLAAASTAEQLFKAFQPVTGDHSLFERNAARIVEHLMADHKFDLSVEDRSNIRYVYNTFFQHGPDLDYTVGGFFGFDSPPTYADLMTADDGQGHTRSFLASEDSFQTIKRMQTENLIVPVVGDFGGPKAIREVGRYLAAHKARVAAFYLSNVERYLFTTPEAWRRFYVNVAVLPYDLQSTFIRSIFDASYGSVNKLSTFQEIMTAFSESRIGAYADVIALSH